MDFLLALTHFCEVHGPTSILSSQIVPSACPTCDAAPSPTPPPPRPSARSSPSSPGSSPRSSSTSSSSSSSPPRRIEDDPRFVHHRADDHVARVAATQTPPRASASSSSAPSSTTSTASSTPNPSASSASSSTSPAVAPDACASCSLTLPEELRNQLPPGGHGASGPVLRSTELVHSCGEPDGEHHQQQPPHITSTALSDVAEPPCHPHVLTYLSQRGPPNAESYALLRNASIRTLMCELLPRGLSAGPLSFGDPAAGYTIAYIFRLPDPMARGKRRSYALIALAGRDGQRAFRASPVIWRVFSHVASGIIAAAERVQRDEAEAAGGAAVTSSTLRSRAAAPAAAAAAAATAAAYAPGRGRASFSSSSLSPPHAYASPPTPTNHVSASASSTTSSFLLGRPPNAYSAYQAHAHYGYSHPRRAGQIRARNLAEIVANQYVFTELHGQFVVLLFTLAGMFPQGGSAGVGAGVGGANVGSLCGGNSSADSGNSGGGGDAGAGGTGGSGPRGSTSCGTRVRTTTVHLDAETEATHKDEEQRDAERSQLPVLQSSASSSTSSTTTLSSAPTPNHNHDHRPSTAACTAKPNHDRLHRNTDDNDAADADNDDDDTTASNNNHHHHNGHGAASGRAGARSLMQHAPPPMRAPLAV